MRPLLSNNRKEKDDRQKNKKTEQRKLFCFLFSDDLMDLAIEGVV
jgi:hypothetical protein